MMSPRMKINIIGVFIVLTLILTALSVFLPLWITYTSFSIYYGDIPPVGIIPFNLFDLMWYRVASAMMYTALGLFLPLIVVFSMTARRVYREDCCHHHSRVSFHSIASLCSLISLLEIVAFALFAIYGFRSDDYVRQQLGPCAYMALASAILLGFPSAISTHAARHDCH